MSPTHKNENSEVTKQNPVPLHHSSQSFIRAISRWIMNQKYGAIIQAGSAPRAVITTLVAQREPLKGNRFGTLFFHLKKHNDKKNAEKQTNTHLP